MVGLNPKQDNNHIFKKIKDAEKTIEKTLWECVQDNDYRKALNTYEQMQTRLSILSDLPPELEKERNRVLSYCLMRIDDALVALGDDENAVERAKEALEIAEKSMNPVQIARCALALGTRLLNKGNITESEEQFRRVYDLAQRHKDADMQQVLGWTFIVRGHILNGKSLYDQALVVLKDAEAILESIDNYAGIAQANELMATVYSNLGDSSNSNKCKAKAKKFTEKTKVEKK